MSIQLSAARDVTWIEILIASHPKKAATRIFGTGKAGKKNPNRILNHHLCHINKFLLLSLIIRRIAVGAAGREGDINFLLYHKFVLVGQ